MPIWKFFFDNLLEILRDGGRKVGRGRAGSVHVPEPGTRDGGGMAVYQLGFYSFGQLRIVPAAKVASLPMSGFGTQGFLAPGACIHSATSLSAVTTLTVREDDPDPARAEEAVARVAEESPFGQPGSRVDLQGRIVTRTDEPTPRAMTFHILALDGQPQGLVATAPLMPGTGYHIRKTFPAGDGVRLRDLGRLATPEDMSDTADRFAAVTVLSLTHGTLVDTPDGPRLVEDLLPGDLVTTFANGSQALRWIGSCEVPHEVLRERRHLRPIGIDAGALGNLRPLLVAPEQRMLIGDWRAQVYFGEEEVLISAKALENGRTIRPVLPRGGLTFCHLLFDRHEVILAEGALTESFHPGEEGLGLLNPSQIREITQLFPFASVGRRRAAFPIMKRTEARAMRLPE